MTIPVVSTASVTLYGDVRSGNCDKVVFTLNHLSIPYNWIGVDSVAGATRTPDFLRMNPQGQIPIVVLPEGGVLAQSNAIVRFFAENSSIMPSDPWLRAKVDEWMFWEANNHEMFVTGCISHMTYQGKSKDTRDEVKVQRANQALDVMEQHLSRTSWFVGDAITAADIVLLAYSRRAEEGGLELGSRPALRAWIDRAETTLGIDVRTG
jgi:glutathione S-transferase